MPLVLGRRIGEKLVLTIDPDADPQQALRALLEGGIEISVADYDTKRKQVRLSVQAPREVLVLREELVALELPDIFRRRNRAAEIDQSQCSGANAQQEMK